jgi:3-deoxy-D-manno-octulosonic acid kinase
VSPFVPPPPFIVLRKGPTTIWAHPKAEPWASGLLAQGIPLHRGGREEGLDRPDGPLRGRGPVHLVEGTAQGERWAVRHFHRGGLLAPLTGDRYVRTWALPRPFAEATASESCRERDVPTPQVMAAAVYRRGPVYRGDMVTRYIPDSVTLSRFLRPGVAGTAELDRGLILAGRLIRTLSERGVRHFDLNAGNILLEPAADPVMAHVLDLDRARIAPPGEEVATGPMVRRLARSLRKLEGQGRLVVPATGWKALEREATGFG